VPCRAVPDSTILIGDEIRDEEAARAAGIASGVVLWGYAAPEALIAAAPTMVFAKVGELAEF
jgi:phosphoglycolate phosphatase